MKVSIKGKIAKPKENTPFSLLLYLDKHKLFEDCDVSDVTTMQ